MKCEIELRANYLGEGYRAVFHLEDGSAQEFTVPATLLSRDGRMLSRKEASSAILHWLSANDREAAAFMFQHGIFNPSEGREAN